MQSKIHEDGTPTVTSPTPETLTQRVVRGGLWIFFLRFTNRVLGFIRTIILARLLLPEDFGLLGIAILAASTLDYFSQTGFHTALIQRQEQIETYLDTAWTVSAIRGILLFIILFLSAPLVAVFFNSPQATSIIQVVALSLILTGFRNVGMVFFNREIEFNKLFIYEFCATLTDLTISLILALLLKNVWALVLGGLAGNVTRLFLSYVLHPYRPNIKFDRNKFDKLFDFGKWVFWSGILFFLIHQCDIFSVGKIVGIYALGLYQMAYLLSNVPVSEITEVSSQVTLPAYAKLQDDSRKLSDAFIEILGLTSLVTLPMAAGIFVLAPDIIYLILGEKWMPMLAAMQILVVASAIYSVTATVNPILYGTKRPKLEAYIYGVQLITLVIILYPLTMHWGIIGTASAVLFSTLLSGVIAVVIVIKVTKCSYMAFGKTVMMPLVSSLFMACVISALKLIGGSVGWIGLLSLICAGLISYSVLVVLFNRFFDFRIKSTFERVIDVLKG